MSALARLLLASSLLISALPSLAQQPVSYRISFANAVHHEAQVTVTYSDISSSILELRMSRSSPGRYALHEFAKNVYSVSAAGRDGNPLPITRPSPYQWNVAVPDEYAKITYTLFADFGDGTYSQIDSSHAHLNMPATFMWARGYDAHPLRVEFADFDPDWKIATQLVGTEHDTVFTAPDLQYFMDSPTEISDFSLREFPVVSNGRNYTVRLAVHHDATEEDVDALADMAQAVVREHMAVYGELPPYDYGAYTFIADYLPYVDGDGMEHRNSTILSDSRSLAGNAREMADTLSHEFFHGWNVERIRPRSLQPFNFERANMSRELWLAEGFTQYYGDLDLHRAGLRSDEEYLAILAGIINTVSFSPGRDYFNPAEMSMLAPFVDAATAIDPTNFRNTFISYYAYGAALALALDLSLRGEFALSLDDFMRALWVRFGKTGIPYTLDDLESTLAAVTGNAGFAADFFLRYIRGSELPDYKALLGRAGLVLQPEQPGAAYPGRVSLSFGDGAATLTSGTLVGSPLYLAGLDRGDQIRQVGRYRIRTEQNWRRMLSRVSPDEVLGIEYLQRGIERHSEVKFIANPSLKIVSLESEGAVLSTAQESFRQDWLGSQAD